jgi:hypothetical protein
MPVKAVGRDRLYKSEVGSREPRIPSTIFPVSRHDNLKELSFCWDRFLDL